MDRLGLGAVPSAVHAQSAADAKLKSQLLNTNKRAAAKAEESEGNALASGSKGINGLNGHTNGNGKSAESSDEEESRAGAISQSKKRALVNGSGMDPFSSSSKVSKKKSKKNGIQENGHSVTTPKRQASPIAPPSSSPSVKMETSPVPVSHEISAKSFYGSTSTNPNASSSNPAIPSSPPPIKPTKNQRKKERERIKAENLRMARLAELEGEELGSGLDSLRSERFDSVAESSGTEDGLSARKGGGGVRAPVHSEGDERMEEEAVDDEEEAEVDEEQEGVVEKEDEAPVEQPESTKKVKKDRSEAKRLFALRQQAKIVKKSDKKDKKRNKLVGKKTRGPKNGK